MGSIKPILKIAGVSLEYVNKNKTHLKALENIKLKAFEGDRICILGPSGCGKSSLLSLISGLKKATSGKIIHRDQLVNSPSSERVIIFQNYALYPWKTAIQNIEFVLKIKNKKNIRQEAEKYLKLVKLEKFKDNYPHELSGGMQQRISIARALSCNPDILLFDEPFASLDPVTKDSIYSEILSLADKFKTTMIFVTHDIEEALFLGKKIIIMSGSPGHILKKIKISLPQTKNISELRYHSDFIALKKRINRIFGSY